MFLIFLTAVIYTNCLYDLLGSVVIPGDNVLVEVLSLLYKVEPGLLHRLLWGRYG